MHAKDFAQSYIDLIREKSQYNDLSKLETYVPLLRRFLNSCIKSPEKISFEDIESFLRQ